MNLFLFVFYGTRDQNGGSPVVNIQRKATMFMSDREVCSNVYFGAVLPAMICAANDISKKRTSAKRSQQGYLNPLYLCNDDA